MGVAAKGYEFVAEIAPEASDILVPKKHPSAFFGTPLASYLINTGLTRSSSPDAARAAASGARWSTDFAYNFRVMVPQDGVFDRSEVSHAVNLFDMSEKYADVMPTDDIIAALNAIRSTATTDKGEMRS